MRLKSRVFNIQLFKISNIDEKFYWKFDGSVLDIQFTHGTVFGLWFIPVFKTKLIARGIDILFTHIDEHQQWDEQQHKQKPFQYKLKGFTHQIDTQTVCFWTFYIVQNDVAPM